MKENRMDRLTDKLNARVERIGNRLTKMNKNVNPYRMERIPDKERLYDFATLTDEDIEFARQNFPEDFDNYMQEMNKLMRRQGNA